MHGSDVEHLQHLEKDLAEFLRMLEFTLRLPFEVPCLDAILLNEALTELEKIRSNLEIYSEETKIIIREIFYLYKKYWKRTN